ncbi:MAG: hypothetical protein K9J13_09885 [Saprospiraceae bacterium]|nr:hypothetical protein [Saprospiraceae bacterium]
MENISKDKLIEFESFIKELRGSLQLYFDERKLSFSNRQLFSFVLNLPFVFGINADGRSSIKENARRIIKDSGYGVLADDLPDFIDELEQVEKHISQKEFEEIYYKEESYLISNFDKYKDLLLNTLKIYSKRIDYVDKYELINKAYRMTKSNFTNEELISNPNYAFINEIGFNLEPFNKESYKISEEQWQQIYSIPYLVFYMIAGADQKISKKEIKEFDKFLTEDTHSNNPLIADIFTNSKKILAARSTDYKIDEFKKLAADFVVAVEILDDNFHFYEASEIKRLTLKLAYDIAASAGFFGIAFVAFQESKQISKIAKTLGITTINEKKIRFGKQVKIGKEEISYNSFYKKLYAEDIVSAILKII